MATALMVNADKNVRIAKNIFSPYTTREFILPDTIFIWSGLNRNMVSLSIPDKTPPNMTGFSTSCFFKITHFAFII